MNRRARTILSILCIAAITATISLAVSFTTIRRAFLDQTRTNLMRLASVLARSLDGDALAGMSLEDQSSERYQTEKDKFRRFREAVPELRMAYFYRATRRPAVLEVVLDALEAGEPDALTEQPGTRFYDAGRVHADQMVAGLTRPAADEGLTADDSGVWLSAYASVSARDGHVVGAVGIDAPARQIQRRQIQLFGLLLLSSVASLAAVFALGVAVAPRASWAAGSRKLRGTVSAARSSSTSLGSGRVTPTTRAARAG
jgi:hypothetical protein